MDIWKEALQSEDYMIRCRRYLHENPELSDVEDNTIAFILKELADMNVPCIDVPKGGVLAFINSKQNCKTVLLRADVDALRITEDPMNNKAPKVCVSKINGVSHVCGHDAHTAILLATAKILSEHPDEIPGNIVLYFERGEEAGNGDYHLMKYIQENNIHIDGCWGLHLCPHLPCGTVGVLPGGVSAGNLSFGAIFTGKNALACAISLINTLNTLRMQQIDPYENVTLAITRLQFKDNERCHISGTCRYHDADKIGRPMRTAIQRVITNTLAMYDCTILRELGPFSVGNPIINDKACYNIAKDALSDILGADNVVPYNPTMGAESFAVLSAYYPSFYARLGCRNADKGMTAMLHNARFDPDEDCLKTGVVSTISYALAFLSQNEPIPFQPFEGNMDEYLESSRR